MWTSYIIRLLRKRIVLLIIFTFSLSYCLLSFLYEGKENSSSSIEQNIKKSYNHPFLWDTKNENDESTIKISTCRNSVQGNILLVDDKGYVCLRSNIMSDGCCNVNAEESKRYACDSCKDNGCCNIYEYCISCCLNPQKKDILQNVLGKASASFNILFASVSDQFELCLAKCRTSSQSVQHENSYRDPRSKYCYGETPGAVPEEPAIPLT